MAVQKGDSKGMHNTEENLPCCMMTTRQWIGCDREKPMWFRVIEAGKDEEEAVMLVCEPDGSLHYGPEKSVQKIDGYWETSYDTCLSIHVFWGKDLPVSSIYFMLVDNTDTLKSVHASCPVTGTTAPTIFLAPWVMNPLRGPSLWRRAM